MPSTSDSRQPYRLSNLDLVTESLTLIAGILSSPSGVHLVEPVDAGGRLLGDAADRGELLGVPAGLLGEALLDRGVEHALLLARGACEDARVLLGLRAEVQEQRRVAAVVEDHVGRAAVRPLEDLVRVVPVLLERLALVREHRDPGRRDRGGGVVLGREDVARGPAHLGAERLERLDQHRRLDRHVERAGDARAAERLLRRVLLADRHQAGHLGLGDRDLPAAPIGELQVGDLEIARCGPGFDCGGHGSLLVGPGAPTKVERRPKPMRRFTSAVFSAEPGPLPDGVAAPLSPNIVAGREPRWQAAKGLARLDFEAILVDRIRDPQGSPVGSGPVRPSPPHGPEGEARGQWSPEPRKCGCGAIHRL